MSVIMVNNVHKKFKVFYDKGQTFKEKILFKNRNYYEDRWVLKGISFELDKGEAIGLIGENGCGKSTLLKLMTRIMYPDDGTIDIKGRVSSLIELGAGFHPDLSGRENIYTNAAIFGLTKNEIEERLKDIIEFSELEEFIDNPVRTYSSGMYMRLAFSVAINVDADVLLIDEILAVGDANFQAKCFSKMRDIKANGTTIVIVSHALGSIEQICERSIWIDNGVIRQQGNPREVHALYMESMGEKREISKEKEAQKAQIIEDEKEECKHAIDNDKILENVAVKDIEKTHTDIPDDTNGQNSRKKRFGNKNIEFTQIEMRNNKNEKKSVFYTGEPITISMKYKSNKEDIMANIGIAIHRADGLHCYGTHLFIENNKLLKMKKEGEINAEIACNNLMPNEYSLDVAACGEDYFPFDDIKEILTFTVVSKKSDVGVCKLDVTFKDEDGIIN